MRYTINESQFENLVFSYLNDYIKDYPKKEEDRGVIIWGEGKDNQMLFDKPDGILFVRNEFFESFQSMFSLSLKETRKVFIDWLKTMGYKVERFV